MRVLVVDDEPDVRLVLGQALRDRGHDVRVASTGQEAIDLAAAFQPEAALVDVGLPDIDGVTLAELIRGIVADRRLRVIGFSGFRGETSLRRAVKRDLFDGYLMKPAPLEQIERALRASA